MEFKVNLGQILGALVQALAYVGLIITLIWHTSRRVANIESNVQKALDKINDTNQRMEKTFDKIDKTFDKMDEKMDRRMR